MEVTHLHNKEVYQKLKRFFQETGVNIHPELKVKEVDELNFINCQFKTLEEENYE